MLCPRCGAAFEGNFCPRCGTPAAPPPAPAPAFMGACPRCGTVYQGNFCPRCGLPAGMGAYAPPPIVRPPSGVRSALSILWTLALVGFLVFIAMNFVGLVLAPSYVVPGIQGIGPGQNANQDLSAGSAGWSFQSLGTPAATGTYNASKGSNTPGSLEMTLPAGGGVGGEWVEAVQLAGSAPWIAEVHFDYHLGTAGSVTGQFVVSVESTPSGLDVANAPASVWANMTAATGSGTWSTTPNLDVSPRLGDSGTYYLKVAYIAQSATASVDVFLDNVHMAWTTDAFFYFYLPLPVPELLQVLYISQQPAQFLAYFGFIVVALLAAGAWYTWRDWRPTVKAFTAPLDAVGLRLRSMSGWVAVAQVWMATMFFQYALILILAAIGPPPSSPFTQTSTNGWVLLFDYSAASVFEEIAFRLFLIGVPMAVASIFLRVLGRGAGPSGSVPRGRGRSALDGLRYLWGGQLRKESPREAVLAAWILVFVSAAFFGLAHAPGWGWWKVLPAFVVGLGMGYVFVRHGIGASILLHFATDGSLALALEGYAAASLVQDLLFLGLAIAGAGFFAWYVIYGWEEFRDLLARYGSRIVRQPVGTAPGPFPPPPGYGDPRGNASVSYAMPPTPPPYPPTGYVPPGMTAPLPPTTAPVSRNPSLLPHGYAPTYHPAPYGYPPVRFQCPYCGWVEARYENRRFTCLRCGRTT